MSIVKMSKISLAGMMEDRDRIIARVMKLGLVEVISYDNRNADSPSANGKAGISSVSGDMAPSSGDNNAAFNISGILRADGEEARAAEYERDMHNVGAAIDIIERYVPEKKPMFYSGKKMRADEYKMITYDFDKVRPVVARIIKYDADLASLRNEENRLATVEASLIPWRAMAVPLEESETASTTIMFGTAPSAISVEQMATALSESAPESYIETVSVDPEQRYMVLVTHKSCEEAALQALKHYSFSKVSFKGMTGTPEHNIAGIASRISEIAEKREECEHQIMQLAVQKTRLQVLYDFLEIRMERNKIVSKLGRSDRAFILEGWLPTKSVQQFISIMNTEASCIIETQEPKKGEEHPILLDNPAIIKPFEAITSMYSLPSARDIDPNLLMAPFYFLFFGMMIGDFAYGIILSIIVGAMLIKLKPRGVSEKMLKMLFLGGFSTAFWGIMFGSYFGNLPQAIMKWVTGVDYGERFYGLWFDPLSDPMKLLIFSMIFGVVHLFVGMGIKIYTLIRDGEVFSAIFDVGSWYLLILGLPLLILGAAPGLYMTIIGAAMLVLTQGRSAKNPIMKFLNGLLSLYSITGYLSDILSYSRLLALGLATGVIAAVINTLAMLNAPGILAGIICLVVIIIGTVFNIAINALGAFVHSSRLQYVEFFSKFYEGGGEEFKPFKIKTKYIKII